MSSIKALLVDDHGIVRAGTRSLLETENDIVVVGEARTASEGISKAGRMTPDVVLMEASTRCEWRGSVSEIMSQSPWVKVLMLTSVIGDEAVISALMAGASG